MNLDPFKLVWIVAGTIIVGTFALFAARGVLQRLMLFAMLAGLFLYSGIGSADVEVATDFIGYYLAFIAAVTLGFHIGRPVFQPVAVTIGRGLTPYLGRMDRGVGWPMVIAAYFMLSAFPLVWPEPRLLELLAPPAPDLLQALSLRFQEETDTVTKIAEYLRLLLTPFFFVALYRLRYRLHWIAVALFALLYIRYVDSAYLGRGAIVMYLAVLVLALWFLRPGSRGRLVWAAAALAPLLLYGFYLYARVRIGEVVGEVGFGQAVAAILDTELGFVRTVGMVILETDARVGLSEYFVWIATLPIPKVLTGPMDVVRINYEISELVLGLPTGSYGWYVVLPGLVAESIYIYGKVFFWLHGMSLGFMAAFFARFAERVPQSIFLYLNLVVMFGYVLNRGGIASLLPPLINEFLLFYVFVFGVVLYQQFRMRATASVVGDAHVGKLSAG